MKDVLICEKFRGADKKALIRKYPNGEIHSFIRVSYRESIAIGGEPRELKHLSTWRNRNQFRDSLSSGERKGNSPNFMRQLIEGCRTET